MAQLAEEICACADEPCAKAMVAKYEAFTTEQQSFQGTPEEQKVFADHIRRFTLCRLEKVPSTGQALVEHASAPGDKGE